MAGTRFKVENGLLAAGSDANSIFEHQVQVNANLTVNASLLYVGGNLYVQGDQIITGTTLYDTDLIPSTAVGTSIGNTTNRFDGYFRNVIVDGYLNPSANSVPLGNTTKRWFVYGSNLNVSSVSTFSGNATFSANITATGRISVSNTVTFGNTLVSGFVNVSSYANVSGNLAVSGTSSFTGNVSASANVSAKGFILNNAAIHSNTATATLTGNTTIDSFPKTYSNGAKLNIHVNLANTSLHMIEMQVIHDGTNVLISRYGEIYNNSLGVFDAAINNANVEIYFSPTSANTYTIKTIRQNILT